MISKSGIAVSFILTLCLATSSIAQDVNPLEGRWDLVITKSDRKLPSWLEIKHSGRHTLIGRFVYAFGSARPVAEVKVSDGKFSFAIPPQWEPGTSYMEFEGVLQGDSLKGTMVYTDGVKSNWVGSRAPLLHREGPVTWEKQVPLFNGKDLSGWHTAGTAANQWVVEGGVLHSPKPGANLLTNKTFTDFKLHIEFRCPKGGNSGIYLRGRYEVQITDSKGLEPSDLQLGGVYGFLEPNQMAAKTASEWQSYDITLIGRRVTIVANGMTIINDQIIPGITGGAIDSKEGEPGPFLLQGDHEAIEFRNILITPAK